jgi:predicted RNase H-like HicB family nuclease
LPTSASASTTLELRWPIFLSQRQKSDFEVIFPHLPSCVTAGKTLEDARKLAVEALMLHMAGMIEDGEALPEPSTLDQLAGDPGIRVP